MELRALHSPDDAELHVLEWSPSDTKEQLVSLPKWLHFAPELDLGSRGVFSPGWGGRRRIDTGDAQ